MSLEASKTLFLPQSPCEHRNSAESADFYGTTRPYRRGQYRYHRCADCGSIRAVEAEAEYREYPTRSWIPGSEIRRLVRFLAEFGIQKQHRVLDYGCGQGALIQSLRSAGFDNVSGYDPHHADYAGVELFGSFDAVLLIHVWEHLESAEEFFSDLEKYLKPGGKAVIITPSASRFPALDSSCPYQSYTIHAPFHRQIPSDRVLREAFLARDYREIAFRSHDIQKSGILRNNAVYALFMSELGGTKDGALEASTVQKLTAFFRHPLKMLDRMFFHPRDELVSSFVFESR